MKNEEIILPYFKELKRKKDNSEFKIDKTGVKTVEIRNCHIDGLNPLQPILEFPGRKTPENYVKKESNWYNSCSLNINGYVDDIKIWKQVSDNDGFVNSNYGWCIYSKENYKQYNHVLKELINNSCSRRASMIYNRPSMWIEYNQDGMNEFMCTYAVQYDITDNELNTIVYMRSNDSQYGFFNDLAWQCEVYMKLYNDLKKYYKDLQIGVIDWNSGSWHIYERHFEMLDKICTYEVKNEKSKTNN